MTLPPHDEAAFAAREAAEAALEGKSLEELLRLQRDWQRRYARLGPTHETVAYCTVIYEKLDRRSAG